MKLLYRILFVAALLGVIWLASGCIHLPDLNPGVVPGPSHPNVKPPSMTDTHTATQAIQHTFNWIAGLASVAGLACLAFGGLAIYNARIVSGVKLVLVGVALPVAGIWFAYHWGLVILGFLTVGALWFVYQDWAKVKPVLTNLGAAANAVEQDALKKLETSKVATSAVPTPGTAAAGPAPGSVAGLAAPSPNTGNVSVPTGIPAPKIV